MAVDRFPVEYTHIMMFARSIADDNPICRDEDYAKDTEVGNIIAPPTFAKAGDRKQKTVPARAECLSASSTWPYQTSSGFRSEKQILAAHYCCPPRMHI